MIEVWSTQVKLSLRKQTLPLLVEVPEAKPMRRLGSCEGKVGWDACLSG